MDPKFSELGIFLFQLIDIQIKKYLKLTEMGVGPDAGMNADLVRGEVEELFIIAYEFMLRLEQKTLTDEIVEGYISQIRFYLDLEEQRAIAGELLDSNNIHNSVYDRLEKQIPELEHFVQKYSLHPQPFKARLNNKNSPNLILMLSPISSCILPSSYK